MKYRVELDISFLEEKDAVAFLTLLQDIKSKIFGGTGEEKIAIVSTCRYHTCSHDEQNPESCKDYVNFDLLASGIEEIKTDAGEIVDSTTLIQDKIDEAIDIAVNEVKPIE